LVAEQPTEFTRIETLGHKARVEAALFQHLIDNSAIPLIGSGIGGFLVVMAHMDSPYRHLVIVWAVLLYCTIAIRIWLVKRCRIRVQSSGYQPQEAIRYAVTTSLSGIAWGLCGYFVLKASPLAMVVTITAIQAMTMGGALTLGAFLPAFLAFALPAILPLICVLAYGGGTSNYVLALYSVIFTLLVIGIAKRLNNTLRQVWQLTFEKEDLVIEVSKAHDLQAKLANTDGLTGISNRRRFDEVLEKEYGRLSRSDTPLSMLLLDVDHFKAFNDTYGHVAGDECLKRIAKLVENRLNRSSDLAARYGGEEFAGILPDTDSTGAIQLAELIRSEVESLQIPHKTSSTTDHVTVSLGVVTLTSPGCRTSTDMVASADKCLYRAKSDGRNRVASVDLRL
jgi:diguanylate cyclase (GGDEF)-like protein